jgi:hypothetical protein
VLRKQLLGLLEGRYFPDPIGGVPLVLDDFEDGIVGFVRFFGDQEGEVVGVADDQIAREATVKIPSSAG